MRADAPDLNPVDRRQSGDAFAAVSCPALRIALREVSAEAAYRRTDLFERRRRLMDDWATYLGRGTASFNDGPVATFGTRGGSDTARVS